MIIALGTVAPCVDGQGSPEKPAAYYRALISFIQLGFIVSPGKHEVAVNIKGEGMHLEAYVASTSDWMSAKKPLFNGKWNVETGSFEVTDLSVQSALSGEQLQRIESLGMALSHPRLRHWLKADVLVSIVASRGGYQVGFSDPNGKGGPGSFQIAIVQQGKVTRILNGY